ncbi:MAG: reverse transcriptase family protein [Terracidiphilus sp.]
MDSIAARVHVRLGRKWRWVRGLALRYVRAFGSQARPRRRDVIEFLRADEGLRDAEQKYKGKLRIAQWVTGPARMQPADAARGWPIPKIETVGELAAWLGLSASELEWFADLKRLNARVGSGDGPIGHYHYRVLAKQGGNIRLIEAPKKRLKELQRVILHELLEKIPTHAAAHGFVRGRSIKTFAAPHVAQRVVLRMDLRDFFPSIAGPRVQAFFRTAGYPDAVASLLGGICTNAAPRRMWKTLGKGLDPLAMAEARSLYSFRHLPQGAPTSPALANLCAYRVDCRLNGLAKAAGATYTRYADDLAFSGGADFARGVERFALRAAAILLGEGFAVHYRKTRVMRQGVRQYLAGLVTNEHINVVRADFDRLKAILTNCMRHGAESQNRDGHPAFRMHLDGRVGFVEMVNAGKGARLRKIFERIRW